MKACSIEDCGQSAIAKGWCPKHYQRWKKHGDPLHERSKGQEHCSFPDCGKPHDSHGYCAGHVYQMKRGAELGPLQAHRYDGEACSIDGCESPAAARTWCRKHWQRWRKYGDPLMVTMDPARTAQERFWSWVDKNGPVPSGRPDLGQCWVWTGGLAEGYGAFWLDGRQVKAHIASYTWEHGEIPEGAERDHLCRNRACVRPSHLEAVTHWVNVARGISPHGQNAAKTHCPASHEYDTENTYLYDGERHCRKCARERTREWWTRKRSKAARTS